MADQASLIQFNNGKLDVQASVNVAEEYYGHVSSALNAGLNGGQGIKNILASAGWDVDFSGVMSVGGWVLQNLPMPDIVSRVANVSLSIATTTEEGAAIGASVLAFTGVGAPLGAAAGAIVGAFLSLKSLFGHSSDPFVPSTFDHATQLIPPPNPEDAISKAQIDRVTSAVPPGRVMPGVPPMAGMPDLIAAFGDKDVAVKIATAYWHFWDIFNLSVADQEAMANRQAEKNGGGDQAWGRLDRAAAQAAIYSVLPDPRTGKKWVDLDWLGYLLCYRRHWERIVEAQKAGLLPGHFTPHQDYCAYLIAKFSSAKMPNAVGTAAAAKNAQSQLPALARAVLQGSRKPAPAPGSLESFLLYYLG